MKKDKHRYFYETNFRLSNFLYAKGQKLANVNSLDSEEKEFVFVRTARLEELEDKYKFGDKDDPDLMVQVHVYEQGRRELLTLIKSKIF